MILRLKTLLFLAMCIPAFSYANSLDSCMELQQSFQKDCLRYKIIATEQHIIKAENNIIDKIKQDNIEHKYINRSVVLFNETTKSYQTYKQNKCNFEKSLERSSEDDATVRRFNCILELDNSRLAELENTFTN